MIRFYLLVLALYAICCVAAHGQNAPSNSSNATGRERTRDHGERSEAATLEAEATSGGSILRASGGSMKYSTRNSATVQPPQPRTLQHPSTITHPRHLE